MSLWGIGNVFQCYSTYYGVYVLSTLAFVFQFASYALILFATGDWLYGVHKRLEVTGFCLDPIIIEDITAFSFLLPVLCFAPGPSIWNLVTGESLFENRSESNLIFLMGVNFFHSIVLIGKFPNNFVCVFAR